MNEQQTLFPLYTDSDNGGVVKTTRKTSLIDGYIARRVSATEFTDWLQDTLVCTIVPMFENKNREYGDTSERQDDALATLKQIGMRNFPGLYAKYPYLAMVKGVGVLEDKHLTALAMDPTTNDYLGKAKDCVIYSLFRLWLLQAHSFTMKDEE